VSIETIIDELKKNFSQSSSVEDIDNLLSQVYDYEFV